MKGSVEALLNQGRRLHLDQLVSRAEHIELETENNFFDIFVEACFFKPMTNVWRVNEWKLKGWNTNLL